VDDSLREFGVAYTGVVHSALYVAGPPVEVAGSDNSKAGHCRLRLYLARKSVYGCSVLLLVYKLDIRVEGGDILLDYLLLFSFTFDGHVSFCKTQRPSKILYSLHQQTLETDAYNGNCRHMSIYVLTHGMGDSSVSACV
jgi:hypothetical protein